MDVCMQSLESILRKLRLSDGEANIDEVREADIARPPRCFSGPGAGQTAGATTTLMHIQRSNSSLPLRGLAEAWR